MSARRVALAGALAAMALALLAPHAAAADDADATAVSASVTLVRADGTLLDAGQHLELGERATLVVRVEGPAMARLFVPSNPALSPFRLVGKPPPPQRTVAGERATEVHHLPVTPLRVGAKAVPPIEIVYQLPDGASGSITTERLRVRIDGRLANEQDPALAAPPAPVPVIATNWVLVWSLSILGAAVLATLLTLIALRLLRARLEAAKPPPPPRPADEVALGRLAELERDQELDAEGLLAAVIDVLREYLGGRYGFDGLEQTTAEMMRSLRGADLKSVTGAEIHGLLDDADLVKFARYLPTADEARALIPRVRHLVVATWEAPEETEEAAEELLPTAEPATAGERLKAGAVDVTLALALGAVVLGGLWVGGLLVWGWLGLVAAGLVLWLRDLAGPGSPGKALLGLRVVRRTPRQPAPSVGRRLARNAPLFLVPIGLPVETLVLIYHPLRHRLGDLWSGTEVVRGPAHGQGRGGTR